MVKVYSPWIEKVGKGKYKYCQRYVDPLRSRPGHIVKHKVTVTLTKKTPQARRQARSMLTKKFNLGFAYLAGQDWNRITKKVLLMLRLSIAFAF